MSASIKSLTVFGSVALCIGPNKFSLFVYFVSIVDTSSILEVAANLLISLPIAVCLPDAAALCANKIPSSISFSILEIFLTRVVSPAARAPSEPTFAAVPNAPVKAILDTVKSVKPVKYLPTVLSTNAF